MTPSDPTHVAAPAAPVAPAATEAATPQSERERIYQQFYVAPPDAPAPPQVDAAPAPVIDAQPPALTTEQVLASVVDKLGQLEQRLSTPPPAPHVAPLAPAAPAAEPDWLALMGAGEREAGEAALAAMLAKRLQPREASIETRVMEQFHAQREAETFTQQIRQQNPDVAPMEPFIGARVQVRLAEAQQRGLVQSPADYVKVYKEAVTQEVAAARNLFLSIRGQGAASATTRTQQVSAQPSLQPQAVSTPVASQQPGTPEIETPESYLAKRQARSAALRGLGA